MFLQLEVLGGSLCLSGWPVLAALVAVAWAAELAVQAAAMRADR